MDDVERVARAIEKADVSWSISLVRLIDGVHTYRLTLGDEVTEFTDTDEAMAVDEAHFAVSGARRKAQATAAIAAMERWQPIETAPRDGTPILGWTEEFGMRETYMQKYGEGSPGFAQYLAGNGPLESGWDWSEPLNGWGLHWKPTHWRPLPAPPAAEAGVDGDGV